MSVHEIKQKISDILADAYNLKADGRLDVSRPDQGFGDFSTNAAMVYAKDLGQAPRKVAELLAEKIQAELQEAQRVEVAGPGFINITISDAALGAWTSRAVESKPVLYKDQVVVTEYSDPNPFKVLHVGHLYTSVVGDAITNLIRNAGGDVHPVNFGGDVGLHVAKTMWAMVKDLGGENLVGLEKIEESERSDWMAKCYVAGERAYGDDESAKVEIMALNKRVYQLVADNDHESAFAQIYWTCRGWSYDYFNSFYDRIGTRFEKYYPESLVAPLGLATIKEQLERGVYKMSDGAIVFEGEPHGLHTRVFITSQGLPTYEAKDVGLIMTKWQDYRFDRSVVITGNDIIEYMKVVLKSVEQFRPELTARTTHLSHGNVKLAGGVKMSSRKGNFLRAVEVLDMATEANAKANENNDPRVVLGAIKYAFLKQRIGADLVFIPEESVSLEGNSGPYLQYAHARARSILAKTSRSTDSEIDDLDPSERLLASKISEYPDIIYRATSELMPHYICTYLYDLSQVFNRFYERSRVIGDERETQRLTLVRLYANVLKDGLSLLGISAPDRL